MFIVYRAFKKGGKGETQLKLKSPNSPSNLLPIKPTRALSSQDLSLFFHLLLIPHSVTTAASPNRASLKVTLQEGNKMGNILEPDSLVDGVSYVEDRK